MHVFLNGTQRNIKRKDKMQTFVKLIPSEKDCCMKNLLINFYSVFLSIGPTRLENSLCLPGLQNMAGVHSASFFCEPRVNGQFVVINQHRADKQMSICEVGVFEESERK